MGNRLAVVLYVLVFAWIGLVFVAVPGEDYRITAFALSLPPLVILLAIRFVLTGRLP